MPSTGEKNVKNITKLTASRKNFLSLLTSQPQLPVLCHVTIITLGTVSVNR